MVNFKLGETNVKMNLSACYERGTKKKSEFLTGFKAMTPKHWAYALSTSVTENSWRARPYTRFTTQYDIDIADPCSIQDACQI